MIKRTVVVPICLAIFASVANSQTPRPDSTKADSTAQKLKTVEVQAKKSRSRYGGDYTRTATKSSALIRDVPQSIATVNNALVRDHGMKSMADVVRYVPGISMGQGEGNRDQPTIRGNATTADFFVDGARDDAQYFRDLYNLERVEAIKGSNAMIFGRGGGGGILNRVTKEAHWISQREVSAEGGTFGERRISADLQQRVSSFVAARLNSVYEHSDLFRNGTSLERSGVNPTLSLANASRSSRLSIGYEHFNDHRTADRGIPSFQGKPVETDPSTFFGNSEKSFARIGVNTASATLSHDAGAVQLRNHTRLSDYDKFYQNIYPSGATATQATLSAYNHLIGRKNIFNQTDATLSARTGDISHDLLIGAEIGRQSTNQVRNTGYFGSATTSAVPLADPVYRGDITFAQSATDADNETKVITTSAYLQDQISISPKVRFLAGARIERFKLHYRDNRADKTRDRNDRMVSPRAGLVIKPLESASFYASYGVSFLPGSGDQFTTLTDITRALEPERFTNYEAGVKWDAADRLALTAAAYRLDRTNSRSVDPLDAARVVQTGAQRSQGMEFGATGNVTSAWEIAAAAARQSATIIRATASSAAGAHTPMVPERTFSVWNKYSFTDRLGAAVGVIRQSKVFAAIDNKVTLPSFTRVDGAAFAGIGFGLRAQLNVENVFNVSYFPTAHSNSNISPGSPRAATLSITAEF
jgi:catecholate siderophore receptor